jgi:hypothetical protein
MKKVLGERLDTVVHPEEDTAWFGYREEQYPESTDVHTGINHYIGALSNEWADRGNGAHLAAQEDLKAASNSVRASLEAHNKGDLHLATQHLDAAALRIDAADRKANAESPSLMGVEPVHAAVAHYKMSNRGAI